MFNKHLFTVILGFCGMILVGLISLTIIDSLTRDQTDQQAMQKASQKPAQKYSGDVILPPIKKTPCNRSVC